MLRAASQAATTSGSASAKMLGRHPDDDSRAQPCAPERSRNGRSARTSITNAASSTVRAIGPMWSMVHDSGTMPDGGDTPEGRFEADDAAAVGRDPQGRPGVGAERGEAETGGHGDGGAAARAAGDRLGSWGLRHCGVATPRANSWVATLASSSAPACAQAGRRRRRPRASGRRRLATRPWWADRARR